MKLGEVVVSNWMRADGLYTIRATHRKSGVESTKSHKSYDIAKSNALKETKNKTRKPKVTPGNPNIWVTETGAKLSLREMSHSHLTNALIHFLKTGWETKEGIFRLRQLNKELSKRLNKEPK